MAVHPLFSRETYRFLDGAMGTVAQSCGLAPGESPALLAVTNRPLLEEIHIRYLSAGSNIIYTNTFSASEVQLRGSGYTPEDVVPAAVAAARAAADKFPGSYVALDIGPTGELLDPYGDLEFEEAVEIFSRTLRLGKDADLVVFETFADIEELTAGITAAKACFDGPIICSMSFDKRGYTYMGCSIEAFAERALELGVSAVGMNCGYGPDDMFECAKRLCAATPENFPVFVKPNAGLPRPDGSGYDLSPAEFGKKMIPFLDLGLTFVGGCCGTSPDYISELCKVFGGKTPPVKP